MNLDYKEFTILTNRDLHRVDIFLGEWRRGGGRMFLYMLEV